MPAHAEDPPRRLLLIGMMGAGKTTVGCLVAERLGWPYLDSDVEVEQATGKTVPEIFAEQGETAFRRAETDALRRALDQEPMVVSVAGGAILDPQNRMLLASAGTVVWLRAKVETLAGRVGHGLGRPLLDGDPATALQRLDGLRRPLYAQLAQVIVDVDDKTPQEVAEVLLGALGWVEG